MSRKWGQHFLIDDSVLKNIQKEILSIKEKKGITSLIEVGPGKGALTSLIINSFDSVVLFEVDTSLKGVLGNLTQHHKNCKIIRGDVLDYDVSQFDTGQSPLVVGNLPYYITSPILKKFFHEATFGFGVFLIQKEVGEKIHSGAKKKSYLWWLLNYEYNVSYEFSVPASSFSPPPKVESAVVSLSRKQRESVDLTKLLQFLNIVSPFKRKTLGKIRKMRPTELSNFNLLENQKGMRLEQLAWDDMSEILGS